jgi:hypothetical protein
MEHPPERRYYRKVKKWMEDRFLCFIAEINKGLRDYGIPDIVGVRDVGGDLSGDVETIIIEVKRGDDPFPKACGQTLSYNIYANRVYLADVKPNTFTPEDLQIAGHLGIGLIQIRKSGCVEVLSSPFYTPILRINLLLSESLGLARCGLCNSFFRTRDEKDSSSKVTREDLARAIRKEKGLVFWNYELADRKEKLRGLAGYGRRFVCPGCVAQLFTIQDERLRKWMKEYERERDS